MPYMPNAERAIIPKGKFEDWVMSPRGHGLEFAHWGFTPEFSDDLAHAFLKSATEYPYVELEENRWGIQYTFYIGILTPRNRIMPTVVIWQIDHESDVPRFITARIETNFKPGRRKGRRRTE